MDRSIYLSMSAASNILYAQAVNSNNMANASTTAFRADLSQFRSMPVFGDGYPSRVYAMEERPGFDFNPGSMNSTGNDLDIAIDNEGWISVLAADGNEAYTRRGDLIINTNGLLENGTGQLILGEGGPISIPPFHKLDIGKDGTITIRPLGQDERTLATVGRIKLVNPPESELTKGVDGLFRRKDGRAAEVDSSVLVTSGTLENSNVNIVHSMVKMIELSRAFELHMKSMQTAQENDQQAAQLLSLN